MSVGPKTRRNYTSVSSKNVLTLLIEPLSCGVCGCVLQCVWGRWAEDAVNPSRLQMVMLVPLSLEWKLCVVHIQVCAFVCMCVCFTRLRRCYDKAAESLSLSSPYTICHQQANIYYQLVVFISKTKTLSQSTAAAHECN